MTASTAMQPMIIPIISSHLADVDEVESTGVAVGVLAGTDGVGLIDGVGETGTADGEGEADGDGVAAAAPTLNCPKSRSNLTL